MALDMDYYSKYSVISVGNFTDYKNAVKKGVSGVTYNFKDKYHEDFSVQGFAGR